MSTLYLVDLFANPISGAKIVDVRQGPDAMCNGSMVVRVPDFISVQNPTSLSDLTTKKHAGLLAFYAGYANIAYDDLTDLGSVDTSASGVEGLFGERNIVEVFPSRYFQTVVVPLVGPAPSQAVVTWESYSMQSDDPATARFAATYVEEASTTFTAQVSFDNGAHFYPATDGGLVNIPPIGRGTQFILRLQNTAGRIIRVGSWAVMY